MADEGRLYDIDIQTEASPAELQSFCELLESNGYAVVTDLSHGKVRVKESDE
jgi:hypothetical protein